MRPSVLVSGEWRKRYPLAEYLQESVWCTLCGVHCVVYTLWCAVWHAVCSLVCNVACSVLIICMLFYEFNTKQWSQTKGCILFTTKGISLENLITFIITRRYGPLRGPSFSSCGGLRSRLFFQNKFFSPQFWAIFSVQYYPVCVYVCVLI